MPMQILQNAKIWEGSAYKQLQILCLLQYCKYCKMLRSEREVIISNCKYCNCKYCKMLRYGKEVLISNCKYCNCKYCKMLRSEREVLIAKKTCFAITAYKLLVETQFSPSKSMVANRGIFRPNVMF